VLATIEQEAKRKPEKGISAKSHRDSLAKAKIYWSRSAKRKSPAKAGGTRSIGEAHFHFAGFVV
jgi:hypothetical protein